MFGWHLTLFTWELGTADHLGRDSGDTKGMGLIPRLDGPAQVALQGFLPTLLCTYLCCDPNRATPKDTKVTA